MTETRLCDCGCGRVADYDAGWSARDVGENVVAMVNQSCWETFASEAGTVRRLDYAALATEYVDRIRSRRAQPKAELEALDFVAPRDCILYFDVLRDRQDNLSVLRGQRVRWDPTDPAYAELFRDDEQVVFCDPANTRRIHAELLALRDGYTNATPPAPSAVEPKPNPLQGLAEAMRSLFNGMCYECRAELKPHQVSVKTARGCLCAYCKLRTQWGMCGKGIPHHALESYLRPLDDRIAAVQPAAVEEVRHPADWYVDPDAPDGCA